MRSAHGHPTSDAASTDEWVPSDKSWRTDELVLTNARVVMRDTMFRGTVHVVGGCIAGIDTRGSGVPSALNLEGDFLIAELVDVHSENLERHLEPRPGVAWPSFAALVAHDRQIAAAGVTTVFELLVALASFFMPSSWLTLCSPWREGSAADARHMPKHDW